MNQNRWIHKISIKKILFYPILLKTVPDLVIEHDMDRQDVDEGLLRLLQMDEPDT